MTRHEQAKVYMAKLELIGDKDKYKFKLLDNDEVVLVQVKNVCVQDEFILPRFVTAIGDYESDTYDDLFINTSIRKIILKNCKLYRKTDNEHREYIRFNFCDCKGLEHIYIDNADLSNISSMSYMFCGCEDLKYFEIYNTETTYIRSINSMFRNCSSLIGVELKSFNTINIWDMGSLFRGCSSIEDIDISNFDMHNLKNMDNMFNGCNKLKNLRMGRLDINDVWYKENVFKGCTNLKSIHNNMN